MNFNDYKDFGYYKNLIKIGIPISCAILVEFIAFNSIAIIMGRVSGVYAAAQNLVCTLTTISFMVPFAVSNAIAVKVGFANGQGFKTLFVCRYSYLCRIYDVQCLRICNIPTFSCRVVYI